MASSSYIVFFCPLVFFFFVSFVWGPFFWACREKDREFLLWVYSLGWAIILSCRSNESGDGCWGGIEEV